MLSPLPAGLAERALPPAGHFVYKTFESGYEDVNTFKIGGVSGAWLSIEKPSDRSAQQGHGYVLRLVGKRDASSLSTTLVDRQFDVREFPLLELDYRAAKNAQIGVLLESAGRLYEIPIGKARKHYPSAYLQPLGKSLQATNNGKWMHLQVHLGRRLAVHDARLVSRVILACVNDEGGPPTTGCNADGTWVEVDNVALRRESEAQSWTLTEHELMLRPTLGTAGSGQPIYEWGLSARSLRDGMVISRDASPHIRLEQAPPAAPLLWTIALTGDGDHSDDIVVHSGAYTDWLRAGPELRVYAFMTHSNAEGHSDLTLSTKSTRTAMLNSVKVQQADGDLFVMGRRDESNREFANEMDVGDNFTAGTAPSTLERAVSVADPKTRIRFYLTRTQAKHPLDFQLTVHAWDGMYAKQEQDGMRLAVLLNDQPVQELVVGASPQTRFSVRLPPMLSEGFNALTLERVGGGDWVTWDRLAFRPPNSGKTGDCVWSLQSSDARPFAPEAQGGESFRIGSDPAFFRRAITAHVPMTHVVFEHTPTPSDAKYDIVVEPLSWDRSDSGIVKFSVALNDQVIATPLTGDQSTKNFSFPTGKLLRKGANRVTLRWLGGSSWLTWKRIGLCRPANGAAAKTAAIVTSNGMEENQ